MSQTSIDRLHAKAKKHKKNGDIDAARVIYTQILESYPQNLRARTALDALQEVSSTSAHLAMSGEAAPNILRKDAGVSSVTMQDAERQKLTQLLQKGQVKDALNYATDLLKSYPDNPILVEMISKTLLMQKNYQEALPHLKKLTQIHPKHEGHVTNLLGCLSHLNDYRGQITAGTTYLAHNPNHLPSLYALVNGYNGVELYNLAADALEKAYALEPENPEIIKVMGNTFLEAKKFNKAIKFYNKRLELIPKDNLQLQTNVRLSLIEALNGADKTDEALKLCTTLIEQGHSDADAYLKQGHIYMVAGKKSEAAQSFRKVLAIDKNNSTAQIQLITLQKITDPNIVDLDGLERSFTKAVQEKSVTPDPERINIGFALGKAYGDLGETAKAFNILSKANQLHETLYPYDTGYDDKLCFTVKHIFSPIDFKTLNPDLTRPKTKKDDKKMIFIVGMPRSGTSLVEQILASHSKVFGGGELTAMGEATGELLYHFSRQPDVKLTETAFGLIGQAYLDNISEIECSESIITDKMPHNFVRLGFIRAAFPEAKIIHINRDPMAVCWSNFKYQFKSRGMDYSYSLENLAHHYRTYLDLMNFWREKFGDAIYELDYEKLTTDQENETQNLLDFCNLDFESDCIDFHKTARNVRTASQVQVREKMYKNSSREWEAYASHLKPLLDGLGIRAPRIDS
jgi:tetratricopeptide (TPR) repeat protein